MENMTYFISLVKMLCSICLPIFLSWGLFKLQKTKILKAYLWFSLPIAIITFGIFFLDVMGMQHDPGPEFLGLIIFIFIAPIYFIYLCLIYFTLFLSLVCIINKIKKWKFEYGLYVITFVFNVLFQYIWWRYFYTAISLPRRIIGWNIITLVFPWLPVLGALFWIKRKEA